MSRRKRYAALAVLATAAVAGGILAGASAGPSQPPVLTDVATANTRSDGYAPASKLSVELRQVVVAQGSTKLDGGSSSAGSIGYYGYDNDTLTAAGDPQMVPTQAAPNTEAHKTEPDKNTYVVFKNSLPGADPHYYYGTHFLFQGHETGAPGYITRINLDADAVHRVTLLATKDVTGANIADYRRLDVGSVGRAAAVHDGERERSDLRGHAGLPVDGDRRLRRARPRRLRGHPGRQRREHLDRRGRQRRRTSAGTTAKRAEQLHLPLRPQDPGRPRERQAAGAAGAERGRRPDHARPRRRRSTRPTRWRCTPTARASRRAG